MGYGFKGITLIGHLAVTSEIGHFSNVPPPGVLVAGGCTQLCGMGVRRVCIWGEGRGGSEAYATAPYPLTPHPGRRRWGATGTAFLGCVQVLGAGGPG